MVTKSTILAAVAATIGAFAAPLAAAGIETIDCAVDRKPAERTICRSQHLQILDAGIVQVYAELMQGNTIPVHIKRDLRESQRNFLARRDACGADAECLHDVMSLRSSRIRNYR